MKKSEMIERLRQFLSEQQGYGEDSSYVEYIVNFLVSQGMQPPQREVKGGHLVPAEDGQEAMLTYSIVVNEWEPE